MVNLLDPWRFDGYQQWIHLGMCLKNISPTLLPLWDQLSMNSQKWDPTCCVKKWEKFRVLPPGEGLGIGSLYYWAKKDNPEWYDKLIDQQVDDQSIGDEVEVQVEKINGENYITCQEYIYTYDPKFVDWSLDDLNLVGIRDDTDYIHWFNK